MRCHPTTQLLLLTVVPTIAVLCASTQLSSRSQFLSTRAFGDGFGIHAQLILEVISKLEGAYGLLFKSAYFPGELVACKRGSPLLLGIKEAEALRPLQSSPMRRPNPGDSFEAFIASDASAFVEHTKQ